MYLHKTYPALGTSSQKFPFKLVLVIFQMLSSNQSHTSNNRQPHVVSHYQSSWTHPHHDTWVQRCKENVCIITEGSAAHTLLRPQIIGPHHLLIYDIREISQIASEPADLPQTQPKCPFSIRMAVYIKAYLTKAGQIKKYPM